MSETEAPTSNTFGTRPLDPSKRTSRRGLGRGLDSLIPSQSAADSANSQLKAPIGSITPNPSQPRREFNHDELEELAASIREHGILQPLLVQPEEQGRYELIAGERRWRAAGLAGLETVPIVVQEEASDDDEERLTLALVENVQRADLNPIELATAFEQLSEAGWTQERIAAAVGKSRAAVANLLRLRRLPQGLQSLVASGALSEGHGRALLGATPPEQRSLAERAVEAGWTVRQLEEAIKTAADAASRQAGHSGRRATAASDAMLDAIERLEAALGTKVEVRSGSKGPSSGGRIVIHWYDEEQLSALAAQVAGKSEDEDDAEVEFAI
jgi:ParB family chromosome partitioning protein